MRRRHLQVTDSGSLVRTSQAAIRPHLPCQLCPGFSWPGSRHELSFQDQPQRTAGCGGHGTESAGQCCLPSRPCAPLPRTCQEPVGSEWVRSGTVLSPQLHHLCNIFLITSKARFLRKPVVCLAITQGGRINPQPAVISCTAWGLTSAAPAPHLRGSCGAPREGQARAVPLYHRRGWGRLHLRNNSATKRRNGELKEHSDLKDSDGSGG